MSRRESKRCGNEFQTHHSRFRGRVPDDVTIGEQNNFQIQIQSETTLSSSLSCSCSIVRMCPFGRSFYIVSSVTSYFCTTIDLFGNQQQSQQQPGRRRMDSIPLFAHAAIANGFRLHVRLHSVARWIRHGNTKLGV